MTGAQRALLLMVLFFLPVMFGWALPGGVTGSVDLSFEEIALRTWPWTLSIAACVWLLLRNPDGDALPILGGAAFFVGLGAFLALAFVPEFELSAAQAANPQYWLLAETRPDMVVRAGQVAAHNPKATAVAVVVGIVATVLFAYWILYGPALWIAGIAAGAYIGKTLHEAFPGEPVVASNPA